MLEDLWNHRKLVHNMWGEKKANFHISLHQHINSFCGKAVYQRQQAAAEHLSPFLHLLYPSTNTLR